MAQGDEGLEHNFQAAIERATAAPERDDAWEELEELAAELQRPEEVSTAYRAVLANGVPKDAFERLAQRAVNFHEEWFGDEPTATSSVLTQILERDPSAEWAFERLTVLLTGAERWDELLAVYDGALARTREPERRKQLLDDAAHVAKDFADQPDRAAGYLRQLLALDPTDAKLLASMERLYERQERWEDLIELWRGRMDGLAPAELRTLRVRIATSWIDRLNQPARALEELQQLLEDSPGYAEACAQLEKVLVAEAADAAVRSKALGLLRKNYDVAERPEDAIRVVEQALAFVGADEQRALHREAGNRLALLGRDEPALDHFAAVLRADPTDTDARKQIRALSQRAGRADLLVGALVAAADATTEAAQQVALLLEAGELSRLELADDATAIELYQRVLASPAAEASVARAAAHALDDLLVRAGRDADRLAVLERLAELETAQSLRAFVLAEAARLAAKQGDTDRALRAWESRLAAREGDLEALGAMIELLEASERWVELVVALRRRAEAAPFAELRRADLVRVARVQEQQLDDADAAIATWTRIREDHGFASDIVDALEELLPRQARWADLANLLDEATRDDHHRPALLLGRLGDLRRTQLHDPEGARLAYERALRLAPDEARARAGLGALLTDEDHAAAAVSALALAYARTDDWRGELELLPTRIERAASPDDRARLLREAAELFERRADQPEQALDALARALPLQPADPVTERELLRVAERTSGWTVAAAALAEAAAAVPEVPLRAAQLFRTRARILEERLEDWDAATSAYVEASVLAGVDPESLAGIARCAARARRFGDAAEALVAWMRAHEVVDPAMIEQIADAAGEGEDGAWAAAIAALESAAEGALAHRELRPAQARELLVLAAKWAREALEDDARAEALVGRAVELDPGDRAALELRIELQRPTPGEGLARSLLRAAELQPRALGALREACDVAIAHAGDGEVVFEALDALFRRASSAWVRGEVASDGLDATEQTNWALEQLVERYERTRRRDQATRLLIEGARLPLPGERSAALRRRAAELLVAADQLERAIELYKGVLHDLGDDRELVHLVADLCGRVGRVAEELALRRRELALVDDAPARIALRVEIARLTGEFEGKGGRAQALRDNLSEAPGHAPSLAALTELLTERARFAELVALLREQAELLETRGEVARAAALWADAATVADKELRDPAQAIELLTRAVALEPTAATIDALAALHLVAGAPREAAKWLQRRLADAEPKQRVALLLRLARARIAAGLEDEAVKALDEAFTEAPRNAEVRKLLIGLLRQRQDWAALARVLSAAAEQSTDPDVVLRYAREAAEIHAERLGSVGDAVPVLQRAVEMASGDRPLRSLLARGQRERGDHAGARTLLEGLLADFGRRRSPERAAVHMELARVAHAEGKTEEALDELDQASKMDAANVDILASFARLARESGALDRAERAYRTLLMSVRRATTDAPPPIGAAEILFELSTIAAQRGQGEQASELVESALEALAEAGADAERLRKTLAERGAWELLRRVLESELARAVTPYRRAAVLAELAHVLDAGLGSSREALDRRIEAIQADPGTPAHHEAAIELAARLGALDVYERTCDALLAASRRDTDAYVRCELLLRLGSIHEKHKHALDRATELYAEAEATGVRQVDVWRAEARVAGARGDEETQLRLLERLAALGADQAETRADALYSLAEVQLSAVDTLDQGLESLRAAIDADARWERAALVLRRASERHEHHDGILDLYEQAARRVDDRATLLHYLDQRAQHPEASVEQVREAVQLALAVKDAEIAERLLLRAVDVGRASLTGLAEVDWALLGLAKLRMGAQDVEGATTWLSEAVEVAERGIVLQLASELLERAGEAELPAVAKLYELLFDREPTVRAVWEPLIALYRRIGDVERLERTVEETLDGLQETGDRNALRVALAQTLLQTDGRGADAVRVLQDALLEDPLHEEAQTLLAAHFEATGDEDALEQLLQHQLMNAQGAGDGPAIAAAALRLGRRLEPRDGQQALDVYRSALGSAPDHRELLLATIALLGDDDARERVELLERVLAATQAPDPALVLEVVDAYAQQDDAAAQRRVLEAGLQRSPADTRLRERLEALLRETGDLASLVRFYADAAEAAAAEQPDAAVALLRLAAQLQREGLGDPQGAAVHLARAQSLAPDDIELLIEVARTAAAAGQHAEAIERLGGGLQRLGEAGGDALAGPRLQLLQARAQVRDEAGDRDGAIDDLEAAWAVDAAAVGETLAKALESARERAQAAGDEPLERRRVIRGAEVLAALGRAAEERALLEAWVERSRKDVEALRRLGALVEAEADWAAVAKVCGRLVAIEDGEAQVHAALRVAHAADEIGAPEQSRTVLEYARKKQPGEPRIRGELVRVYERLGAEVELAKLLIELAAATEDREARGTALRRAAEIQLRHGDTAGAIPALQGLLELDPADRAVLAQLADAHMIAGDYGAAEQIIDAALDGYGGKKVPEVSPFLHRKSRIARARGDQAEELRLLQDAHAADKENGYVAAELADLAEEARDLELAVKVLRNITLMKGACPISRGQAYLRQGKIALVQGDRQRAVLWARRARHEEPDSPEVVAFLSELGEAT